MSKANRILKLYEAHLRKITGTLGGRYFFCINLEEYADHKMAIDQVINPLGGVTMRFPYGMRLTFGSKDRAVSALEQIKTVIDCSPLPGDE